MSSIKFNWVDIVFITLLIRICYIGFRNGVLPEFFRVLGLLTAFILSFNNYILVSNFLSNHTKFNSRNLEIIAFLFIFLFILFVFKVLAVFVTKVLGSTEKVSLLNSVIGLVFACGRGLLLIGLICTFFVHGPVRYLATSAGERSFSSRYVSNIAPFVYRNCMKFYIWHKFETPLVKLIMK